MLHMRTPSTPMKPTHSGSRDAPMPAEMHASTASVGLASCTILASHPALRKASKISTLLGGPSPSGKSTSPFPADSFIVMVSRHAFDRPPGITARSSYSATVRCRSQVSGRTGDWQSPMSISPTRSASIWSLVRISLSLTRTSGAARFSRARALGNI